MRMDWMSFSVGFLAFPVVTVGALGVYYAVVRLFQRSGHLSKLAVSQRSSTLGFSPRLIGEIGEEALESAIPESEPTAKAS